MTVLQNLLTRGRQAQADIGMFDDAGNLRGIHKRAAASVARHSILELDAPAFTAAAVRSDYEPEGTSAGKQTKLSAAMLAGSRVIQAGARPLIIPAAPEPIQAKNGEVFFEERVNGFDTIEAAQFIQVGDGEDLPDSALPVNRARVSLETMPTLGIRIPLTRSEQKSYRDGLLADTAMASIALGMARAVDATLLTAIAATSLAEFSIGAAAALGLEFAELRALIGTAGTAAAVGQDGTLRAAGVLAELTPDATGTTVGAFNRAAVAVSEDIALIAERVNVKGDLVLTAWINCQALLPLPGAFWSVAA